LQRAKGHGDAEDEAGGYQQVQVMFFYELLHGALYQFKELSG
jgi:hypothetical protein